MVKYVLPSKSRVEPPKNISDCFNYCAVSGFLFIFFLMGTSPMNSKLTGYGVEEEADVIFNYKQQLLSIDMKTKVVQHVPRIIFNVFKVFKF